MQVEIPGGRLHVPCPADALVLACVHRAAHHLDAKDLLWLYDIHLLAERCQVAEWYAFADTALDRGVAALCVRGLALCTMRFGTQVPALVRERLSRPLEVEPSAVFLMADLAPVGRLGSDLGALGGGDRIRLLAEVLFPPRSYMRAQYGAKTWLAWQYVRRIARGAGKWLRPTVRSD